MSKPALDSFPNYFHKYVELVTDDNLFDAMQNQLPIMESFLKNIDEDKSNYAYAEEKWTIKELLQHVIDTERIFNYRALCFARKETVSLPGFDEDYYATNSLANERQWIDLVHEFIVVRNSTIILFKSFAASALKLKGISNNNPFTVESLAWITVGHCTHHKIILEERYNK